MKYEEGDIVTVDIRKAEDVDIDFERVEEEVGDFQILDVWNEDTKEYFVEPTFDTYVSPSSFFVSESHIIDRCRKHDVERLYSKSEDDYICPFCDCE